jgi:hypothetical protein
VRNNKPRNVTQNSEDTAAHEDKGTQHDKEKEIEYDLLQNLCYRCNIRRIIKQTVCNEKDMQHT